jgi:FkbM family methyltransferase
MRSALIEIFIDFIEFIFHLRLVVYYYFNLKKYSRGDYIFDVGANKGAMSKLFLKLYENAKIIAFEPLPIFQVESSRVKWSQVAVSSHKGIAKFYVCKHSPSSSLILPDLNSSWAKIKSEVLGISIENLYVETEVPIITIDNFVKSNKTIKSIFILKIDTEGSELAVLLGARKCLELGIIKNIQFESQNSNLRESDKFNILKLLSNFNYLHRRSFRHFFGNFTEEIYSLKN